MKKTRARRTYREDLSQTPDWLKKKKLPHRHKYLSGPRILPKGLNGREKPADLIDGTFLPYNAARLREGCRLFTEKMLEPDVTIGMSLSGALTPAGLGCSSIVPLIKAPKPPPRANLYYALVLIGSALWMPATKLHQDGALAFAFVWLDLVGVALGSLGLVAAAAGLAPRPGAARTRDRRSHGVLRPDGPARRARLAAAVPRRLEEPSCRSPSTRRRSRSRACSPTPRRGPS